MTLLNRFRVPISKGSLAGMWWSPNSGGKILRILLGSYEFEQSELIFNALSSGRTFIDIGANHGYYTLMASRRVEKAGLVIAYEPEPKNFDMLSRHVRWNRLTNTQLRPFAVGAENGTGRFARGNGTGTGKLSKEGDIEVSVVQLDQEVQQHGWQPNVLKVDVEGAEMEVLRGAAETLRVHRPDVFLSTHGDQVHTECCRFLNRLGYQLSPILGEQLESTTEIYATRRSSHHASAA